MEENVESATVTESTAPGTIDDELAAWDAQIKAANESTTAEAVSVATVTDDIDDELAAWDAQMKAQQQQQEKKTCETAARNQQFRVVLDTSVQPIEESVRTLEASAAVGESQNIVLPKIISPAQKTADSMSATELEEVVKCVRTFVSLQNSKPEAVAIADVASETTAASADPAPPIATEASEVLASELPPAIKAPAIDTSEYDCASVGIAKKVFEHCGYLLIPSDVIKAAPLVGS